MAVRAESTVRWGMFMVTFSLVLFFNDLGYLEESSVGIRSILQSRFSGKGSPVLVWTHGACESFAPGFFRRAIAVGYLGHRRDARCIKLVQAIYEFQDGIQVLGQTNALPVRQLQIGQIGNVDYVLFFDFHVLGC